MNKNDKRTLRITHRRGEAFITEGGLRPDAAFISKKGELMVAFVTTDDSFLNVRVDNIVSVEVSS